LVAGAGVDGAVCACATPAAAKEAVKRQARMDVIFRIPVGFEKADAAARTLTPDSTERSMLRRRNLS
jgi:hypothetical protein